MRYLMLLLIILGYQVVIAQKTEAVNHKGFYLSMALGPAFGDIKGKDHYNYPFTAKGTAVGFDIQIGGAIQPNLLLHGTLQIKSIYGPTVNDTKLDSKYSFDENFFGVGITKYTADNLFFTANFGAANYSLTVENGLFPSDEVTTDAGFSFNLRAGKEWMVSKKWGLGAVLFYSRTSLKTEEDAFTERWRSNRFGIYFQATYNRVK